MTAAVLVLGILEAIVCAALARRVAEAKGRPAGNGQALGFFLGPIGLAITLALPSRNGAGRFAGLWDARAVRAGVAAAAVLLVATVGVTVYAATRPGTLDGTSIAQQIQTSLAARGAPGAIVACPAGVPARAGYTFICDVVGVPGYLHVRVHVDNANGDIEWQAIG